MTLSEFSEQQQDQEIQPGDGTESTKSESSKKRSLPLEGTKRN